MDKSHIASDRVDVGATTQPAAKALDIKRAPQYLSWEGVHVLLVTKELEYKVKGRFFGEASLTIQVRC